MGWRSFFWMYMQVTPTLCREGNKSRVGNGEKILTHYHVKSIMSIDLRSVSSKILCGQGFYLSFLDLFLQSLQQIPHILTSNTGTDHQISGLLRMVVGKYLRLLSTSLKLIKISLTILYYISNLL